jgi:hypothetical protein
MALPRRIFIALGDPSDVSTVAAHDVRLQELRETTRERDEAKKRVKELEKRLEIVITEYEDRSRKEAILGGVLLFVLISAFSFAIWLCFHLQPSPPERPPETPAVIPVPVPAPQSHDCKGGCSPQYNREYERFECWRRRSMRGLCFD